MTISQATRELSRALCALALVTGVWSSLAASGSAQEVKWKAPRMLEDLEDDARYVPSEAVSAPQATLNDPVPTLVHQPVDALPAPQLAAPTTPESLPAPSVKVPQPSSGPSESWDPLGFFFSHADDTLPEIEEWERGCQPIISHITPSKPGLFQKFGISGTWVEGGTEDREPAITDFSTFTTVAIPFPIREWPLNITPGFDIRFLDGPTHPDLPARLYDAYVDFTWNLRITQRSTQVFSIAPGYYSDFEQSSNEAFRITGKWVGAYDVVKHRITLITGTLYLGRDDIKMLPMGGLVFTPNDWSRFEAVFPNPRASVRIRCTETFEDWLYTGADFYGGQTWSFTRADRSLDRVTMLDNRAVLGYERRRAGGAGWHLEGGWVFDRDIHFRHHPNEDFTPEATYYVRAGLTF